MPIVRRLLYLLPLLCVVVELGGSALIRARVPSAADYHRAGAKLRAQFQQGDAIASAPDYIDPLIREQVGDLISLRMAGRHDLASYQRLWTWTLAGQVPPEAVGHTTTYRATFGELTLTRYALPEPTERFNLVDQLQRARVERIVDDQARRCLWITHGPAPGGRLGVGTVAPPGHFRCGQGRDNMVAPVVIEDLELTPRYCIWHPARKGQQLRVTFPHVVLSDELVIYAGLYYEHERHGEHPPVTLSVALSGHELGSFRHDDGSGFQRFSVTTPAGKTAELRFEVTSERTKHPGFCWYAGVREVTP